MKLDELILRVKSQFMVCNVIPVERNMDTNSKNNWHTNNNYSRFIGSIFFLFLMMMSLNITPINAETLNLDKGTVPIKVEAIVTVEDQLPLSRVAQGTQDIHRAWFAGGTKRYAHGVLGDRIEATQLVVETKMGTRLMVELPADRVFEDLEPRVVDINNDNTEEVLVVVSEQHLGASLVVYGIVNNELVQLATTPFLGQAYRWLNPLGVGDFDGDGNKDIALVATPHIGGLLRLYHINGKKLIQFAEYSGVSTHYIGSTELGLGVVVSASPRDLILVPEQSRRRLLLLEWKTTGWHIHDHLDLPSQLTTSLTPISENEWQFEGENEVFYNISVAK